MPQIPANLVACSTTECIAALLYLGWTHEEIAAETGASKGTVQNRRDELEAGDLAPPPEAFDLVRTREREVHRVVRDTEKAIDEHGAQVADRMAAIADLDALDIGPDGDITYEELVAFATIVAEQMDEFESQEVVKRLAAIADRVDDLPDSSETVATDLGPFWSDSPTLQATNEEWDRSIGGKQDSRTSAPVSTSEKYWSGSSPDSDESVQSPTVLNDDDIEGLLEDGLKQDHAPLTASEDSIDVSQTCYDMDREECRRRGGTFDEDQGICRLEPSTLADKHQFEQSN